MHIKQVSVVNYRSCLDSSWSPDPRLSVLIGPNGSGKTNLLSALRLLRALSNNPTPFSTADESTSAPSMIRTDYDIDGVQISHTAKLDIVTNERNLDEIVKANESWLVPSNSGRRKTIHFPSWVIGSLLEEKSRSRTPADQRKSFLNWISALNIEESTVNVLKKIAEFHRGITYYSASQFTNPSNTPTYFEVEGKDLHRTGISITGHKKLLFDIYQEYRNKSQAFNDFKDIIGPNGIGLVDNIAFEEIQSSSSSFSVKTGGKLIKREKTNLIVVPRIKISSSLLSPNQLSEGTFKTLALVFYLVTDKSSLLMIEEPEVCIHHGLLSSLVELIKAYSIDRQTIVSTHSDSVLDRVELENLFSVRRTSDEGTKISNIRKNMKGKNLKALRDYLTQDGNLGEYWKHGDLESLE